MAASAVAIRIYCRCVNASMRANLANLANLANVGGRDASFDDDVQAKRLWRRHPPRLSRRASPSDPDSSTLLLHRATVL